MGKRMGTKKEWEEFRKEILELVILYKLVNEYSSLSDKHIKLIGSFYYSSRKNTVKAFYIQLGFILSNGCPTLKNFVSPEEFSSLYELYKKRKLKEIRDKRITHNLKTKIKQQEPLSQDDVDLVFNKVIEVSKQVDEEFNDPFHYDSVLNGEGIKSLIPLIENSIKLIDLENQILNNDFKASVEMDVVSGEIKLIK